jgi:hypothetical protein
MGLIMATDIYCASSFINKSMSRLLRAKIECFGRSSSSVLLLAGAGQLSAQTSALDERISLGS